MKGKLKSIRNQTIALAGLAQAVFLVQQIAKRGSANGGAMEASIASVLKIDADDVEGVYGGIGNLKTGFEQLKRQLMGRATLDPEQAQYAAMLVYLQRKLSKQPDMQERIRLGIEKAGACAENNELLDDSVLGVLAETYRETISNLNPKIVVNGEQNYLTDPENANKIRALLLAGIRSALLWQQCGGSRLNFFFGRRKILEQAQQLANMN